MFLDVWREKRVKRNLDEAIAGYSGAGPTSEINRVGILVDTTALVDVEELGSIIGDFKRRIHVNKLCYVDRVNKNEFHTNSVFDDSALNWLGDLKSAEVDFFLNQEFDLLISYYTCQNLILKYITAKTKAHFKVGLAMDDDHRLNDLTIATRPEEIRLFCGELKRYLKILKRIE